MIAISINYKLLYPSLQYGTLSILFITHVDLTIDPSSILCASSHSTSPSAHLPIGCAIIHSQPTTADYSILYYDTML
jgi:hypothetical protein